ncbi:MAG: nicotinamide riboside transporter PnuC [Bacteroidales bacterium]|nr:nicotinamide riboside transporter PnuC [Bacteroidales bacterium]MCI1784789.1 nicotinamide riboside transporter PnuC [Bacteroidales bacterium]
MKITEKRFNTWFYIFLVTVMTAANLWYSISSGKLDLLATGATLLGVISCVLSATGNIWTFLIGLVQVSLAALINYKSNLFGQFALHAFFYLPMQIIGFWQWHRRGARAIKNKAEGDGKVKVRKLDWRQRTLMLIGSTILIFAVNFVLKRIGSDASLLDSAVTVLSIIAQILLTFAFVDQWILWNVANIIDVVIWSCFLFEGKPHSELMLIMWICYLLNSLNGYRIWNNLSKEKASH